MLCSCSLPASALCPTRSYCSLSQKAHNVPDEYSENTGAPKPQIDRNVHETRQFRFAMCEMSRMYAFSQCEVIVLPTHDSEGKPFDSVEITERVTDKDRLSDKDGPCYDKDGKPVDLSKWGRVNSVPYESRGWSVPSCQTHASCCPLMRTGCCSLSIALDLLSFSCIIDV